MQTQSPQLHHPNSSVGIDVNQNISQKHLAAQTVRMLKAIVISFLVFLLSILALNANAQTVSTFNTTNTWTCPIGVTSVKVECWGGGGAGGGFPVSTSYSGGGGGGAYTVNNTLAVTPGFVYDIIVGAGGASTNLSGSAGGNSTFARLGTNFVSANGGGGGTSVSGTVGVGGAGGTGGTFNGGNGAGGTTGLAPNPSSGGGGGGAGSTGAGGNAGTYTVILGVNTLTLGLTAGAAGGTDGGIGGVGRGSVSGSGNGNVGATYGGGGSGGRATTAAARTGGKGGDGFMRLTYTIPPPNFILRPFTARFNNPSVKGNIIHVSNSIISSTGNPGVTEVPPAGTSVNGPAGINIDIDADVSTFNSSSSDITLTGVPSCSRIIFAGLYWGAGEGSATGTTTWITGENTCKIKIPGSSTYTTVTSAQTDYWNPTVVAGYAHTGYKCFANITSLLNPTSAYGTYTVANVASSAGKGDAYGGWSIVIAYENTTLAPRNISIYDGMAVVKSGSGNVDVALGGFLTPPSGPVSCELGSIVFDGDRTSNDGYAFKQNGAASFYDLTPTAFNPTSKVNDMFNSTIATKGVVSTTRNPAYQNTLGYDANIIEVPNAGNVNLSNNQTSATVRIFSPSENFIVHALTTSISQFTPTFSFDKTGTDLSGGALTTGDSIRYRMNYNNLGNDASINSVISDAIPIGSSYIGNSLKINGIAKTDAVDGDEAEYDFVNNKVVFRVGVGATNTVGGTIPKNGVSASGFVSFDAIIVSTCRGVSCVGDIKNVAKIDYAGLLSGISSQDSSSVGTSGCFVNMPVSMAFSGPCFQAKDTLVINPCPTTYVTLPYRKYAGYRFYGAKPFIPANLINPYVPVSASHTYWAFFTNTTGCEDTIKINAIVIDCNDIDDDNDGIPDYVEFNNNAATQDANSNGIPNWNDPTYSGYINNNLDAVNDNFDWAADSDNDGNPNFYDSDFPGYVDTNGDAMNDNADKDKDGMPNQFDLDSDNDGVPDVVESYGVDTNGDGIIDNFLDTDGDGFSQNVDASNSGAAGSGNGLSNIDFDNDGIANYLDLDSDNDGIPDIIEAGGIDINNNGETDSYINNEPDGFSDIVDGDLNNDGIAENIAGALLLTGADVSPIDGRADTYPNKNFDQDGRPDAYDVDSDMDGILDVTESGFADVVAPIGVVDGVIGTNGWSATISSMATLVLRNTDATGKPDYLDIDADDDGIPDNIEAQSTAAYLLPTLADSDNDGLANVYDNVVGYGGIGIGFYNFDADAAPDYIDLDSDNDSKLDIVEGNDFNLNGLADDVVNLTGLDIDFDGLDNRFDSLTSVTNIKGTSYRMGNAGSFVGDATPGARTTVQKTLGTQPDRDWRYVNACTLADTNFAIAPQTGSINWNALAWSRGHVPTCCESVHITYTGTNAGVDAVTINITNDICIRNLTLQNAATSATNKLFKTVLAFGYNMVMHGNVRMWANAALTSDSCIFIADGNNNITVDGNTVIGLQTDIAHSVFGSSPNVSGIVNYVLQGDSLTFNARGLSNSKFVTINMVPNTDSAYFTNNTNASPYPEAVKFENLRLGNGTKATAFLVMGSNQNNFLNDRVVELEVKTNATLILESNFSINSKSVTSSLKLNPNSTLKLGGYSGGETGSNFPKNFTTSIIDAQSTVLYFGGNIAPQTVFGTTYGKLVMQNGPLGLSLGRAQKNSTAAISSVTSINLLPQTDFTLGAGVLSSGAFNQQGTSGLYCNANVVSGVGVYTMGDACYLGSGHAQGLYPLGQAMGNMQMTGGRTYTSTSNYIYNGAVNQITGVGLPAIINEFTVDNPTIVNNTNNLQANGLIKLTQGVFDINTTKFTSNGVSTITATTGKIKADAGIIEMKGNTGTAQTLSGNWFVKKEIRILTNANTKGITIAAVPADTILINEALDYGVVTNSTITTNDNLTLLSRLNKTANYGNATSNFIVGKVNVERYLQAKVAWRLLATPIQIATSPTVAQAWRESNAAHTATGYGTRITGPAGTYGALGTLDDYSINPSMKSYNAATNNFTGIVNANTTPIANLKGYYVFVRGDRAAAAIMGTSGITNLRIKGDLRTGDQPFSVPANKFESVGNPFASRLDMRTVTKTNIVNAFYVWNPSNLGSYNLGAYEAYVFDIPSGNYKRVGDGLVNNYIESGQAFYLQSNVATIGSMIIKEGDKGNGSANVSRPGVTAPTLEISLITKNADSTTYVADGVKINYNNAFSADVDNMDVRKINNTYDNISIKNGNINLIVERRPNIVETDTIKLNINGMRIAKYGLEIDPSVLTNTNIEGTFVDKFTGVRTAISFTDVTPINFEITADVASKAVDRFMIVFKAAANVSILNIAAVRNVDKTIKVNWAVANEANVNSYSVEHSNDGINFTTIKTESAVVNNGGAASYATNDNTASIQKNWYRIKANFVGAAAKYSAIALVNEVTKENVITKETIAVLPTTAGNTAIKVMLSNYTMGKYSLIITNAVGQKFVQSTINIDKDKFICNIKTGLLAVGKYQVTLLNDTGVKISQAFMVQ